LGLPIPCDQSRRREADGIVWRRRPSLGEFYNLHFIGIDSKGNVYSAEVQGKRVQKFRNNSAGSWCSHGVRTTEVERRLAADDPIVTRMSHSLRAGRGWTPKAIPDRYV
jgi:hypothetical protein